MCAAVSWEGNFTSYVFSSSDPGIIKLSVSVSKLGILGPLISPPGVYVECCVCQMWLNHLLLLPFLEYVPNSKCVPWRSGSDFTSLASLALCTQGREVNTAENSRGVLPAWLGWTCCWPKCLPETQGTCSPSFSAPGTVGRWAWLKVRVALNNVPIYNGNGRGWWVQTQALLMSPCKLLLFAYLSLFFFPYLWHSNLYERVGLFNVLLVCLLSFLNALVHNFH